MKECWCWSGEGGLEGRVKGEVDERLLGLKGLKGLKGGRG